MFINRKFTFTGIFLFIFLSISTVEGVQKVRLQLKWEHQFQFAGYYAAEAKGFYRAAGLEVEFIPGKPGQNWVSEVVNGKAEFGVGATDLLIHRDNGDPVVVLAVIFQHSPLVIMSLKENGLQSIHDLAGHTIMLEEGSSELSAYLNAEGLYSNRYAQVPHNFSTDALVNGEVDAMSTYITDEPFLLRKQKIEYSIFSPRSAGIDFYGDNLFTTETLLKSNPELVKAFRSASLSGWEYAMKHPEEIIQLIHTRYNQQKPLDHLRYEAEQMITLLQTALVEIGHSNPGRWQHIAETYTKLGMLQKSVDLNAFLFNPNPQPADLSWFYLTTAIALLITALVSLLAFYIYRINSRLRQISVSQQKTSQELVASEELFRKVIENVPFYLSIVTLDGKIRYINSFGKSFFELEGSVENQDLSASVFWSNPAERKVWIDKLQSGLVKEFETKLKTKSGREVNVLLSGLLITYQGELCVLSTQYDITAQKKAEKELLKSEEVYRLLIDLSPDLFWILNLNRNCFTYISPTIFELRGLTAEEAMLERLEDSLDSESQEKVNNAMVENLDRLIKNPDEKYRYTTQIRQRHKDGHFILFEITTRLCFNELNEVEIFGVSRKIENSSKND